jgi:hypothetical protein
MAGSDEDRGKSRRLGAEVRDSQVQVGYSVARRSRGRVMLCVVCTVYNEMRSMGFVVQPQNQGRRFLPV